MSLQITGASHWQRKGAAEGKGATQKPQDGLRNRDGPIIIHTKTSETLAGGGSLGQASGLCMHTCVIKLQAAAGNGGGQHIIITVGCISIELLLSSHEAQIKRHQRKLNSIQNTGGL